MLLATPGMMAPAATATNPANKAYSIRSWPQLSFQILDFPIRLAIVFIGFQFVGRILLLLLMMSRPSSTANPVNVLIS